VRLVDRGRPSPAGVGVEAAHGSASSAATSSGAGTEPAGASPPSSTTWETTGADGLLQERAATAPERDPGGGLPGGGALEDRPGLAKSYFCMPTRSACPGRGG
jgi:hypothetical protein